VPGRSSVLKVNYRVGKDTCSTVTDERSMHKKELDRKQRDMGKS
jgi:hypothetical protein